MILGALLLPAREKGRARGPAALGLLLLALVAALLAAPAWAAPKFPPLTGRVVDGADILSDQAEAKLTADLAGLEQRTGRQVVVATVPDLQGYEIEDYGYQLGRTWGIGHKDKNDGVVFLVAPKERKVRIEVGYGLEPVLTDALSNVILQERVLPAFRAGNMEQGVVSGTEAVIQQLELPDDEAKARVAQAAQAPQQAQDGGIHIPTIIIVLIVFWVLSSMLRGLGGRRRSGSRWWLWPIIFSGGGGRRGGWGGGGGWSGGGGGGGFSGGGGSFGGGGSSGSW